MKPTTAIAILFLIPVILSDTIDNDQNREVAFVKDPLLRSTDGKTELYDTETTETYDVTNAMEAENVSDVTTETSAMVDATTEDDNVTTGGVDVSEEDKNKTEPPKSTTEAITAKPIKHDDPEVIGQRSPKTEIKDQQEPKTRPTSSSTAAPHDEASQIMTIREWLEDPYLRTPAGLLVPLRATALSRALALWNNLITADEPLKIDDIIVIGFDANGVSWRSRHNLAAPGSNSGSRAVTEVLSKLLYKHQDTSHVSSTDATMKAIAVAAKMVPYDSAVFLITDKEPADPERMPLALKSLVEKRQKLYTIWTEPHYTSAESEIALQELRNLTDVTEGDVVPFSIVQIMDLDKSTNDVMTKDKQLSSAQARSANLHSSGAESLENLETLLVKRGGGDAISLGVPVETGVAALRIYIEGAVEHAILYPPNEAPQIDLFNLTSVESFSPHSGTVNLSPRDVSFVFPGAQPTKDMLKVIPMSTSSADEEVTATAGVWHISLRCDTCDYRLTVCARARIRFNAEVLSNGLLNLRVYGPVATVREATLIDEYGNELSALPFSFEPSAEGRAEPREGDPDQELTKDVPLPEVKGSRVYAKIAGRDVHGESFVRLSGPISQVSETRTGRAATYELTPEDIAYRRASDDRFYYNDTNILPNGRASSVVVNQMGAILTSVNIGLSSKLYGAPGDNLQIHFEVTNYRDQAIPFRFEAVGELRFLRGISPDRQTLLSGQTATVVVSVGITTTAQPGARDFITFTAYGSSTGLEQVSVSTYVYVTNPEQALQDTWSPTLRHVFQGSCVGKTGDDCATHPWAVSVMAKDGIGGLLKLSSTPVGLMYSSNFIAGTREEVTAVYRATCCAPRVLVTAVDAFGNANSYAIDISNYFTPAAISAIVLGVLFGIALIILIGVLIYFCVKRQRDDVDLPYLQRTLRRDLGPRKDGDLASDRL